MDGAAAEDPRLLGDDRHSVEPAEPCEHRLLRGRVDQGRVVTALTGADDGLAIAARRPLVEHALDVGDRVAAER